MTNRLKTFLEKRKMTVEHCYGVFKSAETSWGVGEGQLTFVAKKKNAYRTVEHCYGSKQWGVEERRLTDWLKIC